MTSIMVLFDLRLFIDPLFDQPCLIGFHCSPSLSEYIFTMMPGSERSAFAIQFRLGETLARRAAGSKGIKTMKKVSCQIIISGIFHKK